MSIRMTRPTTTITLATNMAARAEWEALAGEEKRLTAAAARKSPRLASAATDPDLEQVREKMRALEAEMAAGEYTFTLTALPHTEYRLLIAAHPPRDGNAEDAEQRVNVSTFGDALAVKSITGVTDPQGAPVEFDPATEWGPLADDMTNGQWRDFYTALVRLNQATTRSPRSRAS